MDYPSDIGGGIFIVLLALVPAAHGIWCWRTGIYQARSLRVVRRDSPIEFHFWLVTNFLLGLVMLGAGVATLVGPIR